MSPCLAADPGNFSRNSRHPAGCRPAVHTDTILSGIRKDKVELTTFQLIAGKLTRLRTLELFHQPAYHNSLQLIGQLGMHLNNVFTTLQNILFGSVQVGAVFVVLWTFGPLVPLVVVLSTLPRALLQHSMQQMVFSGVLANSPEQRTLAYLRELLMDGGAAQEATLFGYRPFIGQLYRGVFGSIFRRNLAVGQRDGSLSHTPPSSRPHR